MAAAHRFSYTAAPLEAISFIARPSRVPAAASGAVLGSAFLFDRFQNLVLAPTPVSFRLAVEETAGEERSVTAKDGVAWVQLDSGRRSGPAQFTASSGEVHVRRVVQQVAADPCSIRMNGCALARRQYSGGDRAHQRLLRQCRAGRHHRYLHLGRMRLDAARWMPASSAASPEPSCPARLPPRFRWPPESCSEMKSTGEVASERSPQRLLRADCSFGSRHWA